METPPCCVAWSFSDPDQQTMREYSNKNDSNNLRKMINLVYQLPVVKQKDKDSVDFAQDAPFEYL